MHRVALAVALGNHDDYSICMENNSEQSQETPPVTRDDRSRLVSSTLRFEPEIWRAIRTYAAESDPKISFNAAVTWLIRLGLQVSSPDRTSELVALSRITKILEQFGYLVDNADDDC
jgi:hypothetical protein